MAIDWLLFTRDCEYFYNVLNNKRVEINNMMFLYYAECHKNFVTDNVFSLVLIIIYTAAYTAYTALCKKKLNKIKKKNYKGTNILNSQER